MKILSHANIKKKRKKKKLQDFKFHTFIGCFQATSWAMKGLSVWGEHHVDAITLTFQERLSSCLEEERQRGREVTERALQDARAEREAYVQQQRQVSKYKAY